MLRNFQRVEVGLKLQNVKPCTKYKFVRYLIYGCIMCIYAAYVQETISNWP